VRWPHVFALVLFLSVPALARPLDEAQRDASFTVASILGAAAVAALGLAYLRLRARARVEQADEWLREEIDRASRGT
jgi:hypothetical protein